MIAFGILKMCLSSPVLYKMVISNNVPVD